MKIEDDVIYGLWTLSTDWEKKNPNATLEDDGTKIEMDGFMYAAIGFHRTKKKVIEHLKTISRSLSFPR